MHSLRFCLQSCFLTILLLPTVRIFPSTKFPPLYCTRLQEARTKQMQAKIVEGREALLREMIGNGRSFALLVEATTKAVLGLMDTVLMPVDLGSLPGDENITPQRKSLRRLRKAFAKKQALEARGESEKDVTRFRRKVWGSISPDELGFEVPAGLLGDGLPEGIVKEEDDTQGDDAAAASIASKVRARTTIFIFVKHL